MIRKTLLKSGLQLLAIASAAACGPERSESADGKTWLVLDVAAYDPKTSRGILKLQARGGDLVQLVVSGGTILDEEGTSRTPLCIAANDLTLRNLPFSINGDTALVTALLFEAVGETASPETWTETGAVSTGLMDIGANTTDVTDTDATAMSGSSSAEDSETGADGGAAPTFVRCTNAVGQPLYSACCVLPNECGCSDGFEDLPAVPSTSASAATQGDNLNGGTTSTGQGVVTSTSEAEATSTNEAEATFMNEGGATEAETDARGEVESTSVGEPSAGSSDDATADVGGSSGEMTSESDSTGSIG